MPIRLVALSLVFLNCAGSLRAATVFEETFGGPINHRKWELGATAEVGDGVLTLPSGMAATIRSVVTTGAVAISFRAKLLETGPDPYLALRFGPTDRPDRYLLTVRPEGQNGFLFFTDRQRNLELFRALGYLRPLEGVQITLRLYPRGRRLTYGCDGAFYGERMLADDEMVGLGELTGFTFFAHPNGSHWRDIRIETIEDTPAPLYETRQSPRPQVPVFPKTPKVARKLLFLGAAALPAEEQFLAVCLQGIVNQSEARVYLGFHHYVQIDTGEDWRSVLQARGHEFETAPDLSALVRSFARSIDGVILYDPKAWAPREHPVESHQINIATTAAGILRAVPVTPGQQAKYFPDAPVLLDLRSRWTNARNAYAWAWREFRDRCSDRAIAHLESTPYCTPIRDYLVAHKLFAFLSSDVRSEADYRFYLDLLAATPANTPVIGMTALLYGPRNPQAVFDEDALFRVAGELGKFFVYAFSSGNLSVHSGVPIETLSPPPSPAPPPLDPTKVYLAFMCSEGENLSWGMDLRAIAFRSDGGDRAAVAKGWSLPGAMIDVCPAILEHYYRKATPNDAFFLDGAGLADHYNMNLYAIRIAPEQRPAVRERFYELTRAYLDRMGLNIVRPFDPTASIPRHTLEEYARELPGLTALFTGYNAERGLEPGEPREFMLDGVPVFRTRVASGHSASDEANAAFLVKGIRAASGDRRPAFLNVFVLGNYVINSTRSLQLAMEQLGPEYVALRPEHFADLYRQHNETPADQRSDGRP